MRRSWIARLAAPGGHASLELDATRFAGDEVVEGFLVASHDLTTYPLVAGIAVVPPDLETHVRAHGNVLARIPMYDPRIVRFVLGTEGGGFDKVPFDEVVAHYADLVTEAPEGQSVEAHPEDATLELALGAALAKGRHAEGCGVVLGSGVGRGAFVLRGYVAEVLGLEWSLSRVRRARNLAATQEPFLVPFPKVDGRKREEHPLDLTALTRDGVDFAAGGGEALPFRDHSVHVVVMPLGDARGPWPDAEIVRSEALRVLAPGGVLVAAVATEEGLRWEATAS